MKRSGVVFVLLCIAILAGSLFSQEKLVDFDRIYYKELVRGGFELQGDQDVHIKTAGWREKERHGEAQFGNAWILNAATRAVVWELHDGDREKYGLVRFDGTVALPAGKYEMYYTSFPTSYYEDQWDEDGEWHDYEWRGFRDLMRRAWRSGKDFHWNDDRYRGEVIDDFQLVLRGRGRVLDSEEIVRNQKTALDPAVISFNVRRNDIREMQGFRLKRPTEIAVYAVGEARRDGNFDYGAILNTRTLERVWVFTYRNSESAGGARKNRMSHTTIKLPPGSYAAMYSTDDSHAPVRWNSAPPYDPAFWGMTVNVSDTDKGNIELFDYNKVVFEQPIIDFTRVQDDEFRSRGFTVKKPMNVRIVATGEGGDEEMHDYGWVMDAKTRRKVWEMVPSETEHAGGGEKNRTVDKVIRLDKGSYVASFVSDDSHSYRDWNTAPPMLPELWGMVILPAEDNFSPSDIADHVEEDETGVLARIIRMRDYDSGHQSFKLDKETDVRIYALGEGRSGGMYDYGWIEDAKTGKLVWEMSYRKTGHAGGASKNRLVDDLIRLKAGGYLVFYETDDSHAFGDWNASPPRDPESWGITIFLANN